MHMSSASSARARWSGWASGTNETPGVAGLDVSERISWGGGGGGRDTSVSEEVSNSFLENFITRNCEST
jgi:hypothetical protein